MRSTEMSDFLNYLDVERNASKHTIRSYRFDLDKLDRGLPPGLAWGEVDRKAVRLVLGGLKDMALAPASLSRCVSVWKSFFKFLSAEEYIKANPLADMQIPKKPATLPRHLSYEEVSRLVNAPLTVPCKAGSNAWKRARTDYVVMVLLKETGCRISEVLELKLDALVLDDLPRVRFFGKGSKERAVPLSNETRDLLRDYLKHVRPKLRPLDEHVFWTAGWGTPLERRPFYYRIKNYGKLAGIEQRVHPHLLRHSFATIMSGAGMPIQVLSSVLGHANISTTQIYSHVTPELLRASYDAAWGKVQAR